MLKRFMDIQTQIIDVQKNLELLFQQKNKIDKKITPLINMLENRKNMETRRIIARMPKRLENLKPEHWKWILEIDHREGMERHTYSTATLLKAGFSCLGYWQETQQRALKINCDLESLQLAKKYFHLIKPYVKTMVCKDRHHGTDSGIKIAVHLQEEENDIPVIYVHKNGVVNLYISRFEPPIKFKSFDEFMDKRIRVANARKYLES